MTTRMNNSQPTRCESLESTRDLHVQNLKLQPGRIHAYSPSVVTPLNRFTSDILKKSFIICVRAFGKSARRCRNALIDCGSPAAEAWLNNMFIESCGARVEIAKIPNPRLMSAILQAKKTGCRDMNRAANIMTRARADFARQHNHRENLTQILGEYGQY